MSTGILNINAGSAVLSKFSIAELRAELATTLQMTARHLVHLADVWRELERRGEDLSDLRSGLWRYMPLIANGALRAELVVRYAGNAMLLRRLSRLSDADQDRLLANGVVSLVTISEDGFQENEVPLARLRSSEINLVIRDRLIDPAEQRLRLGSMPSAPVGRAFKVSDRIAAAAAHQRLRRKGRRSHHINLSLSNEEWDTLNENARMMGLPTASVVAGALAHCGLFAKFTARTPDDGETVSAIQSDEISSDPES